MLFPAQRIIALLGWFGQDRNTGNSPGQSCQKHWLRGNEFRTRVRGAWIVDLEKLRIVFRRIIKHYFLKFEAIGGGEDPKKKLWAYLVKAVSHEIMRWCNGKKM